MATLIPDVPGKCTGSERQVFHRLERELDEDWLVLHSLGLANHDVKLWGEADFVVVSTKGIFVIEVKGGEVACRDGVWHFGKPETRDYYSKKEGPFEQAKDAMFALKRILDAKAEFRDLLVGYGVVMPHAVFTAEGPEIEPGVLIDNRAFGRNLGFYVGRLNRFWDETYRNKHGLVKRLPHRDEIQAIRKLLRPDVESTLSLGSYLNGIEQDLIQLTNRQIKAARGLENNSRTVVKGRAGTGKTVLAIDRARRLAAQGNKVLYLCFNKLLATHVRLNVEADPAGANIRVMHLHALMKETISAAGLGARLNTEGVSEGELFGKLFPELFVEAALAVEPEVADILIVDEAQDLLTQWNLDALDLLVKDGLRKGKWSLFLDPLQNIYGKDSEVAMEMLGEAGFATYELYENCRNTRQIAVQTSLMSGVEMALDGAIDGISCECLYYADATDCIRKVDQEVARLRKSGVVPSDLLILSPRKRQNSVLATMERADGLALRDIADGPDERSIHFSTIHAFKGLERKAVIVVDIEGLGQEAQSMLYYAGLSRAMGILRPFLPDTEREGYQGQAVRFGHRLGKR